MDPKAQDTLSATSYTPAKTTPTILIIEDDHLLAHMYSEKFTIDGFNVQVSHDGIDGLEHIKRGATDCVLLDLHIPKLGGMELLEKLQAEKIPAPPILALTNIAEPVQRDKAISLGVKEYLIKAMLTPEAVVKKVKACIPQS